MPPFDDPLTPFDAPNCRQVTPPRGNFWHNLCNTGETTKKYIRGYGKAPPANQRQINYYIAAPLMPPSAKGVKGRHWRHFHFARMNRRPVCLADEPYVVLSRDYAAKAPWRSSSGVPRQCVAADGVLWLAVYNLDAPIPDNSPARICLSRQATVEAKVKVEKDIKAKGKAKPRKRKAEVAEVDEDEDEDGGAESRVETSPPAPKKPRRGTKTPTSKPAVRHQAPATKQKQVGGGRRVHFSADSNSDSDGELLVESEDSDDVPIPMSRSSTKRRLPQYLDDDDDISPPPTKQKTAAAEASAASRGPVAGSTTHRREMFVEVPSPRRTRARTSATIGAPPTQPKPKKTKIKGPARDLSLPEGFLPQVGPIFYGNDGEARGRVHADPTHPHIVVADRTWTQRPPPEEASSSRSGAAQRRRGGPAPAAILPTIQPAAIPAMPAFPAFPAAPSNDAAHTAMQAMMQLMALAQSGVDFAPFIAAMQPRRE
ncbi:hypothetical protein B0H19DRAFT_1077348 [Mycena capillaripes]|nr:hypothetical protein B0H19DRAFT_1077348 [Mycena capillaripes]